MRPLRGGWADDGAAIAVVVKFQAGLPLADMKARLVLNRLSGKARNPVDQPAGPRTTSKRSKRLTSFTVFLTTEADAAELRGLADVEGVEEIRLEAIAEPGESGEAGIARREARAVAAAPVQQSEDLALVAAPFKVPEAASEPRSAAAAVAHAGKACRRKSEDR